MSSAAEVLRPDFSNGNLKVTLSGKLVEQRHDDGVYYTVLVMAAADSFSQPKPFEIRSQKALGNRGEIVTIDCEVGGYYKRTYEMNDKKTGEVRRVRPVGLSLDLVE